MIKNVEHKTVAGKSVGKDDDSIVVWDKESNDFKTVKIRGRYLYVKKCKRKGEVDGIALPYKTQCDTTMCLVLAVGEGCGKWHDLSEDEDTLNANLSNTLFEIVECTAGDIKVHDKVFFPDVDPYGGQKGISRTTYADDEYLIHECLAIGKVEE